MFDGVVSATKSVGFQVETVDISSRGGSGTFYRILDYSVILLKVFILLLINRIKLLYLVTSQSRRGFYRDFWIIGICRLFRVKVVTHQYGANYNQMLNSMNKREIALLKRTTDYISSIIVEGEYMKNQFSFYSGYQDKVRVIPNGLPIEGVNVGHPKTYSSDKGPFRLFYLSNLIYSKGYFDVLRALELLVHKHKLNVKCVFAGQFLTASDDLVPNISNKEDFDVFIKQHNLVGHVEYFSGLYGDQKDYYFHTSNAFILPTYYINEGQPVSILEAMAYGCVPIVTNYRHIPMMVNEFNGCYVEPNSPESICEAVITLMEKPDLYAIKSIKSIEDYKAKFRFDIFSTKVLDVINDVLNK